MFINCIKSVFSFKAAFQIQIHFNPRAGSRSGSRSTSISFLGSGSTQESIDLDPDPSQNEMDKTLLEGTVKLFFLRISTLDYILSSVADPDMHCFARSRAATWLKKSWNQQFLLFGTLNIIKNKEEEIKIKYKITFNFFLEYILS